MSVPTENDIFSRKMQRLHQYMMRWLQDHAEEILSFDDCPPLHITRGVVGSPRSGKGKPFWSNDLHPRFLAYMDTPEPIRIAHRVLADLLSESETAYELVLGKMRGWTYTQCGRGAGNSTSGAAAPVRRVIWRILDALPQDQLREWRIDRAWNAWRARQEQRARIGKELGYERGAAAGHYENGVIRLKECWREAVAGQECAFWWNIFPGSWLCDGVLWHPDKDDGQPYKLLVVGQRYEVRSTKTRTVGVGTVQHIAQMRLADVPEGTLLAGDPKTLPAEVVLLVRLVDIEHLEANGK